MKRDNLKESFRAIKDACINYLTLYLNKEMYKDLMRAMSSIRLRLKKIGRH